MMISSKKKIFLLTIIIGYINLSHGNNSTMIPPPTPDSTESATSTPLVIINLVVGGLLTVAAVANLLIYGCIFRTPENFYSNWNNWVILFILGCHCFMLSAMHMQHGRGYNIDGDYDFDSRKANADYDFSTPSWMSFWFTAIGVAIMGLVKPYLTLCHTYPPAESQTIDPPVVSEKPQYDTFTSSSLYHNLNIQNSANFVWDMRLMVVFAAQVGLTVAYYQEVFNLFFQSSDNEFPGDIKYYYFGMLIALKITIDAVKNQESDTSAWVQIRGFKSTKYATPEGYKREKYAGQYEIAGKIQPWEIRLRLVLSFIVNHVFAFFICITIPLFLSASGSPIDFCLNSTAVWFIVELDGSEEVVDMASSNTEDVRKKELFRYFTLGLCKKKEKHSVGDTELGELSEEQQDLKIN